MPGLLTASTPWKCEREPTSRVASKGAAPPRWGDVAPVEAKPSPRGERACCGGRRRREREAAQSPPPVPDAAHDALSPQQTYHMWSRCLCWSLPPCAWSLSYVAPKPSPHRFWSWSRPGSSLDRISISFFEARKSLGHQPRPIPVLGLAPQNNPDKDLPASESPPLSSTTASLQGPVQVLVKSVIDDVPVTEVISASRAQSGGDDDQAGDHAKA